MTAWRGLGLGRAWLLAAAMGGLTLAMLALPPIAQPLHYHDFADQRACGPLPNCLDTASNLLFVMTGLFGLRFVFGTAERTAFPDPRESRPYALFFLAIILVGLASGLYHLAPDNTGLAWDRAAIAFAFMAWFAAIVGERVSLVAGERLLPVVVLAGVGSVAYWYWSETHGVGDLRPYLLMQAAPIVLIPLLLWLYPPRYSRGGDILIVIVLYLLALLFDLGDRRVFGLTDGLVSGHTLKHVIAAAAAAWVVRMLRLRTRL